MWHADITNDPTRDMDLYIELMEDDELRARIDREHTGELTITVYGGQGQFTMPAAWLVKMLAWAEEELPFQHSTQAAPGFLGGAAQYGSWPGPSGRGGRQRESVAKCKWSSRVNRSGIPMGRAILIARRECIARGWPWLEPVRATYRWGRWWVHTNYRSRGLNVRMRVHGRTGKVVSAAFRPR